MIAAHRTMASPYMEWAKTRSQARYNLATSGIASVPKSEFPLDPRALEITSPGGYGYEPLQERLARHTGVSADSIVAATGTSMANHLAMAAVLAPGDEVLIEQPAYGPLLDVAHYLGARVTRIARPTENAFALNLGDIERAITPTTRLIVLTNLHNPSGALLPADTLREIGERAQKAGARVLVDEVYLEMLFADDAPFAFAIGEKLGGENPFISTSSLTKLYGLSGLRCGWIAAARPLAAKIWRLNDLFGSVAPHVSELLAATAFDHLDQFRDRARAILEINRPIMDAFLDSRRDLDCFRPIAGTVFFPHLVNGPTDAFVELLREKYETSVVPGRFFEMPQHFRVGIGGDTGDLRAALRQLGAALDEFSAQRRA
ncbi:MAG: pyridoxal phosphate-dependent aminotransferase [Verrucomicrobiota bacterium]|nr:pyridoxal phosphate-dependent aminotransferase [Verrucomicrobiota bacterium]